MASRPGQPLRSSNAFDDPLAWVDPHKLSFDYNVMKNQLLSASDEAAQLREVLAEEKKTSERWRKAYEEWKAHSQMLESHIEQNKANWERQKAEHNDQVRALETRAARVQVTPAQARANSNPKKRPHDSDEEGSEVEEASGHVSKDGPRYKLAVSADDFDAPYEY